MLSKNTLIEIVTSVVHEETGYPKEHIGLTKDLVNELDIDSISMLTIFVNIQEKSKITIPDGIFAELTTVEKVVDYLLQTQKKD